MSLGYLGAGSPAATYFAALFSGIGVSIGVITSPDIGVLAIRGTCMVVGIGVGRFVTTPRISPVVDDGFIGPRIGRSGFKTMAELAHEAFSRYQTYIDEAYAQVMSNVRSGKTVLRPDLPAETQIGAMVDAIVRIRMRAMGGA